MISPFELFTAWLIVFLTLCIFSYLYDDNPFYKAAEHLYVGVSAGYVVVTSFWQQVQPNMLGRLWPKLENISELGVFYKIWYFIYEIFKFFDNFLWYFRKKYFS